MRLFPHNFDFFKLFAAQVEELKAATKIFHQLERDGDIKKNSRRLKTIEHQADEITHDIIRNLNQTFITPIDREDITSLASSLDSVIDEMERAINRLYIYQIDPIPAEVFQYGDVIEKAVLEVAKCVKELTTSRNPNQILKHCEIINIIEDEADQVHRNALSKLLNQEKDPIKIIKLREIYEALENVNDWCENVANVLETIVVKNF